MHEEALKPETKNFFPRLKRFKNFYLVGGTALALQIGHRVSVDFDLFTSEPLPLGLLQQVKRVFVDSKITVTYRVPEQLNVLLDDVKCTFFFFGYPPVDKLKHFQGVPLASVREIAAMKAFSIGKRLFYKDYIDWYFLLKEQHVRLPDIMRLAKKRFRGDFNDRLFLGQLVSLKDIPSQKIDFIRGEVERGIVEKFLKIQVRNFPL